MEIPWHNAQHMVSPLEMLAIIHNAPRGIKIEQQEWPRKQIKQVKQGQV